MQSKRFIVYCDNSPDIPDEQNTSVFFPHSELPKHSPAWLLKKLSLASEWTLIQETCKTVYQTGVTGTRIQRGTLPQGGGDWKGF